MRYYVTPKTLHVPLGLMDIGPPPAEGLVGPDVPRYEELRRAYVPRQDIWLSSRAWWLPPASDEEKQSREQYEEDDAEFMELCRRWQTEHGKP